MAARDNSFLLFPSGWVFSCGLAARAWRVAAAWRARGRDMTRVPIWMDGWDLSTWWCVTTCLIQWDFYHLPLTGPAAAVHTPLPSPPPFYPAYLDGVFYFSNVCCLRLDMLILCFNMGLPPLSFCLPFCTWPLTHLTFWVHLLFWRALCILALATILLCHMRILRWEDRGQGQGTGILEKGQGQQANAFALPALYPTGDSTFYYASSSWQAFLRAFCADWFQWRMAHGRWDISHV